MFPLYWFDFIQRNAQRLFEGFVGLFPEIAQDQDALENLRAFAHGGENDGLAHLVAAEFKDIEKEHEDKLAAHCVLENDQQRQGLLRLRGAEQMNLTR